MSITIKTRTAPILIVMTAIFSALVSAVSIIGNNFDWGYGFLLLALLSFFLAAGASKRPMISNEISIAYIARLAMFLLCTLQNDGDADGYAAYAVKYAAMPIETVFLNFPTGAYLYSWVISFLFRLLGGYYTPVRAMNMAISVCCVYVTTDIANELYNDSIVTKKCALWMALFPNLIRFSSYFANREPLLMIFTLLYLKHSYKYYKNSNIKNLILSIFFLVPAMILHTSMLAMMALTGFIILSRNNQSTSRASNIIGKALLVVLMAGTFVFMLANGIGTEKFSIGGGVELSVSGVSKIGNMSASGRAAYLKGVNFSNPIMTILFLPVRMLYFMYTPFPWMLRAVVDLVGLFDAVLYIYFSVQLYKKTRKILRDPNKDSNVKFVLLLFWVLLIIIAMFAAVTSNYGTAIRHRCKLFPIMLLIVGDTLEKQHSRKSGYHEN